MTLAVLIANLLEAKEHFVPGKSQVIVNNRNISTITDVEYDNKNVTIITKEV